MPDNPPKGAVEQGDEISTGGMVKLLTWTGDYIIKRRTAVFEALRFWVRGTCPFKIEVVAVIAVRISRGSPGFQRPSVRRFEVFINKRLLERFCLTALVNGVAEGWV